MRTFDNKLQNSMLKFANIHNNNARIWLCLSFDLLFAFDPLKIINIFFRKDWFILWLALILIIISCCDSVCITSVYADYGEVCFAFDFQQFLANCKKKKNLYHISTCLCSDLQSKLSTLMMLFKFYFYQMNYLII